MSRRCELRHLTDQAETDQRRLEQSTGESRLSNARILAARPRQFGVRAVMTVARILLVAGGLLAGWVLAAHTTPALLP